MNKIVSLYGPAPADLSRLTDLEAGLHYLLTVVRQKPDITWGQLAALAESPEALSGWWSDLGKAVTKPLNYIGRKTGEAVRLVTDERVMEGVGRIGAAVGTNGMSEAANGVIGPNGSGFLSQLGGLWKQVSGGGAGAPVQSASMGGLTPGAIALGVGGVLAIILLTRGK